MRLGFVGLGRMGLPMCERLVGAGFDVVATDLRPALREQVSARWADGPARVADGVELVVTMLPGIEEVAGVVDELASALAPGACWIEMSSAAPRVARACRARGVRFVDAPVGGGPAAAREGSLVVFAGGEAVDLERCRPALDALAERILHVGPSGSGYAIKLLVNALWFTHAAASAEALTLGKPARSRFRSAARGAPRERRRQPLPCRLRRSRCSTATTWRRFAGALLRGAVGGVTLADELDVSLDVIAAVSGLHDSALERYGDVDGELLGGPAGRRACGRHSLRRD